MELATWDVPAALRTAAELAGSGLPGPAHVRGLAPALARLEVAAGLAVGTLDDGARPAGSEETGLARAQAERDLLDGRHREAAVRLQTLLHRTPALPPEERWLVLADLVEAQVAAGDLGAAAETWASQAPAEPGPGVASAVARAAALVAPPFETHGAFARALVAADAERSMVDRARGLLAYARRLGPTTAGDEAGRLRDEAALLFAHQGLEGWARHARALVAEARPEGPQVRLLNTRLDDHEAGIVRLLLLGEKNREVAGRLYVSLRSLEKSLTQIYAKVGVASKAELLAVARSGGAPPGAEEPDARVRSA